MDIKTKLFTQCFMFGHEEYGNIFITTERTDFSLWCMPGQCSTAILVNHGLTDDEPDYNDHVLEVAIKLAKEKKFSALIVTDNEPIEHLIQNGFVLYSEHESHRSQNTIYQYIKYL